MLRNLHRKSLAGKLILSGRQDGVLGAAVPATGPNGRASLLYPSLSLPADADKRYRVELVTAPAGITGFYLNEDGSFGGEGPNGSYSVIIKVAEDSVNKGNITGSFVIADSETPADAAPSFTGAPIANLTGTSGATLGPIDIGSKFTGSNLTFSKTGTWPSGATLISGVLGGTYSPVGTYSASVTASNSGGNAVSNTFTITVNAGTPAPNASPTISLTQPSAGAAYTVGNTVVIQASASDSDGTITKVEFYAGATKIGEDTAAPWQFNWTPGSAGSYVLKATATDNLGAQTTSGTVSITINAAAPPPPPPPPPSPPSDSNNNFYYRVRANGFAYRVTSP